MSFKAKQPGIVKPKKPRILIFGEAGVGKTWTAIDFPSAVMIDTEGGAAMEHYQKKLLESGGVYLGPDDGSNDFQTVLEQVQYLATHAHSYRTLVIDSFSKLFATAIAIELTKMDKAGRDLTKTFSAEKKPAVGKTKQLIAWFDRLDMTVLIVCHEKMAWADGEQQGATFDGYEKLSYELDMTMRIMKQGAVRKAKVGKCRLQQFREGEVIDWSYKSFAERFGVDVIESPSKPVEPATAEQISLAIELAGLTKLDDDTRLKWFEKAGVESWGEMDAVTIQKCIEHFTSKLPKAPTAVA